MKWAYGITSVPSRHRDLLLRTVRSLKAAGFDKPRLFVDGARDCFDFSETEFFDLEVTTRYPVIHLHGNWVLSLYELFIREPNCDRYALFQDDIIAVKNLVQYLEATQGQEGPKTYLNLYTHPENEALGPTDKAGWFPSNQLGKGLQGLVMSHQAVRELLCEESLVMRSQSKDILGSTKEPRCWKNVDGGLSVAFRRAGWLELCHTPSLLQHVGDSSAMGNRLPHKSNNFPGTEFDAMTFIQGARNVQVSQTVPTVQSG